ncbi:family 43 glycosylhydrolase [Paenibacillus barcinonensis]|uniref:Arabinoxylan arabinofuranohydrolase n=1 Tax=Paenibacillus barcinonensis TaxID=198119 RepID=A0A2V4VTA8_PAEBA|nr:glycoside hydrolase family 43 protein [Paenibacillus barcinonensis]PYE47980.1 arabinoxylan arabinofuranohydrolase [Paenibacillus barcinonensis]QKS55102.1 family 43 glycosylhydrolase [Paenibacillus barcinonensis]
MNNEMMPQAIEQREIGKLRPNANPLVAHKFGADPYALVYNNRVYLYMTSDKLEYDADEIPQKNSYQSINKITVISSEDLMNWTDHGEIKVAGPEGAATWASQSWAPAAAHRLINGQDRFYLYFANNASGIGVLSAPTPIGPWSDPIGKALVTRATPGVEDVTWLFDPAVLVDDDNQAYLYFGGGVPEGKPQRPDTARVMRLGADMVSVEGSAQVIPAPFMFENSGIHKHQNIYYYTYCSNFFQVERDEDSPPPGEIAYMTSTHPMGPWTYQGTILKNPGHFFGIGGNNHHAIFPLGAQWYIAYHAQTLCQAMDIPEGYRSTHLNLVEYEETSGRIKAIHADYAGVEQLKSLDPFHIVSGSTIGWSAGVNTRELQQNDQTQSREPEPNPLVSQLHAGSWIALSRVDFGKQGAAAFTASLRSLGGAGILELRLGSEDGNLIGSVHIPAAEDSQEWMEGTTSITGAACVHDLYLVLKSAENHPNSNPCILLQQWTFEKA